MRSICYYDEVNRKFVYKEEYTIEEIMEKREEEKIYEQFRED